MNHKWLYVECKTSEALTVDICWDGDLHNSNRQCATKIFSKVIICWHDRIVQSCDGEK